MPESALDTPTLTSDASTEVAVIGGGFTGLSAALHLAQAGVQVTLLEAKFPGFGATGRNGGFCCLGGAKAGDGLLLRRHGEQGRRDWRMTERNAVECVSNLLQTHGIDADTHSDGETILAHSARAFAELRAECDSIKTDYGVAPELHDASDLAALGMSGPFQGGMTIPIGFALNPRKYVQGLLAAAQAVGVTVHSYTPVLEIAQEQGLFRLKTPTGIVSARKIILATNAYSSEDVPDWFAARQMPAQSNVLVTRPLTENELQDAGWTSRQMAYDTRDLLHYFRLLPDNRMLFGRRGGLGSSPRADAKTHADSRAHFERMFPAWADVETPFSWQGAVCLTYAQTPYVGPVPGLDGAFAGFGYHGNGVAMGSYAGAILADLAQGKRPQHLYPQVMRHVPPRFPLGRYRRALMPIVYAGSAIRDWLN